MATSTAPRSGAALVNPTPTNPPALLDRHDRLDHRPAGMVLLVAAHGGCGASTLTAHAGAHTLVQEAALRAAATAAVDEGVVCVVVAAATADGTARAVRTLHHLERAGFAAHRLRLALVRDGRGPMPVAARARLRLLSAVVDGIDVLPHVQRWRYESGTGKSRSGRYERAVERFATALLGPAAPSRGLPLDDVRFYDDDPLPDHPDAGVGDGDEAAGWLEDAPGGREHASQWPARALTTTRPTRREAR